MMSEKYTFLFVETSFIMLNVVIMYVLSFLRSFWIMRVRYFLANKAYM